MQTPPLETVAVQREEIHGHVERPIPGSHGDDGSLGEESQHRVSATHSAALPFIADHGSFTLISGIVPDEPIVGGVILGTINQTVEGFVRAAAFELPRGIRINCVSPTVLAESVAYPPAFPGFARVAASEVALAYLRAIATPVNGRVIKLHKTSS